MHTDNIAVLSDSLKDHNSLTRSVRVNQIDPRHWGLFVISSNGQMAERNPSISDSFFALTLGETGYMWPIYLQT